MVDFIEAVDTINEPQEDYLFLNEDDNNYIFEFRNKRNPIEAGSFYAYVDPSEEDLPDIAIDNICFTLREFSQSYNKVYFPKNMFDLGSVYQNVSDLSSIELNDPFISLNASKNNMIYSETGTQQIANYFQSSNNLMELHFRSTTSSECYWENGTDTSYQTFHLYFDDFYYCTINTASSKFTFWRFSSFTEIN